MINQFAPIGSGQSFFDLAKKPPIVIDKPFNRLAHQSLRIATSLSGQAVELRLQIGTNVHFHATSVKTGGTAVNEKKNDKKTVGSPSRRQRRRLIFH